MKVAIVHPSLAVRGGAENVVMWLAHELHRRGHSVSVVTTDYDEGLYGPRNALSFQVLTFPLGGYTLDPTAFLRAGWRLRHVLAGFDWINPHNFPAYIWAYVARIANPRLGPIVWFCEEPVRGFYPEVCNPHVLALQRRNGVSADPRPRWRRRVSELRNWRWELARVMDRCIVPRLRGVVANSEFIASEVRQIFGVPAAACHLGIPEDRFTHLADGPPSEGPYLFTVSRLFPEKNLTTILAAVQLLRERGALPFRRYLIAGDGPLRAPLEATARAWGLGDVVEFTGAVSDARLATLYRHAALIIYLPLDETFGLVFLEAALLRRPVLGPDHGGPAEIVRHGVTGLQVDPLDPERIAEAIVEAFRDPHRLAAWGEEGHRLTMREYTFRRFVDRFDAAVRPLVET